MRPQPRRQAPFLQLVRSVLFRTKVIDCAVGMFMAFTTMAMLSYRGGTFWETELHGHRFWENFLCDLLHRRALNGESNVVCARLALIGMFTLIVGIGTAFSLAPEVIPSRKRVGRGLAWVGGVSAIALVLAPLFPSDLHPRLHSLSVALGGTPALISFAILVGAILLEPAAHYGLRGTSLALLVVASLSMVLYVWNAFFHGPSLRVLPGLERVATGLLLVWLLLVAKFVRARLIEAYLAIVEHQRAAATRK